MPRPSEGLKGQDPLLSSPAVKTLARWRRWVFEIRAPSDEFLALMQRALVVRGLDAAPAERFDLVVRAFGARGYVKVAWVDEGIEVRAKIKSGLFASPLGMERALLEAGRDAQARLTYDKGA